MGQLSLFEGMAGTLRTNDRAALVSRYKRLREASMHLNSKLVKRVPKDVLDEGGKKLGILQRGKLVLDNEDQLTV